MTTLWAFEVSCGKADVGACHRCERNVLVASMGGMPFCLMCLKDAERAILQKTAESGVNRDSEEQVARAKNPSERLDPEVFKLFEWRNELFEWRDAGTDAWGEDLVSLLAGLGGDSPDHRLPPNLKAMWERFGRLDEGARWAHAEAYVKATEGGEIRKCWPE
jgi:hypothetical protein